MTVLFEDTVHPDAVMSFWKLQFNMKVLQTVIFVVCAHGCCVYSCYIDIHYRIIVRNKNDLALILRRAIITSRVKSTPRRVLLAI